MNIDLFIIQASYDIKLNLDYQIYNVIMDNHTTHDLWFDYQEGKIIGYEVYSQLDDSSVTLSDEDLKKLEKWFVKTLY